MLESEGTFLALKKAGEGRVRSINSKYRPSFLDITVVANVLVPTQDLSTDLFGVG